MDVLLCCLTLMMVARAHRRGQGLYKVQEELQRRVKSPGTETSGAGPGQVSGSWAGSSSSGSGRAAGR